MTEEKPMTDSVFAERAKALEAKASGSKLKNLLRSKFIAAVLVVAIGIVKKYVPDLPEETIYGLLAYIGVEGIADALGALKRR